MSVVGTAEREQVSELEDRIRESKRELAALRQRVPHEASEDHELTTVDGPVRLSELFGGREELVVIHNMGASCAYCTLWGDGLNGLLPHLESRAAVVMVSPDAPDAQRRFAQERGWSFRLASLEGGSFPDEAPAISVLTRAADGSVDRVSLAQFGPGDSYCVMWDILDLFPGGAGDWSPGHRS